MFLKEGDLIQYNTRYYNSNFSQPNWVFGLVLGPTGIGDAMRVLWSDDWKETDETNPREGGEYRMVSPGSSAG